MKGCCLWKRRSGAGSEEGTIHGCLCSEYFLFSPPLALVHPECLVFIADGFSIKDLCFCQEHGPEPRLFTVDARTEKWGKREEYVQERPFVFLFRV